MSHFTRILTGGVAATALAVGLVGCTSGADASDPASDGLQIVTTTTQLTDFATNVTADTGATVTGLMQPGASAHGFEATAADLETIRQADVVIANGVGLEPWLEETLAAAGFEGTTIDASSGIDEELLLEGHDHDAETSVTDEAAAGEPSPAEDAHDHGDINPHIWTAPALAADMTSAISEGLVEVDAENAEAYSANAAAYVDQLDALDTWISDSVAQVPEEDRVLVTNHDSLTYYNEAYGITFVGSIIPNWDDNAEPSAAEIDALVADIKEYDVPAVFSETQLSPATAEAIANEAGVKVYTGDEALFTDALAPAGSDGATYISSTVHNTAQLLDSWGSEPADLPTELQEA